MPAAEPSLSGGPIPSFAIEGLAGGAAHEWAEVVHAVDAEVRATFSGGWLDGMPAITRRASGTGAGPGSAWYVATSPVDLAAVVDEVLDGTDIAPLPAPPADVEIVERGGRRFVLNHGEHETIVDGRPLAGRDARVERIG